MPRIGLIVSSQRTPRANLHISQFVHHSIKTTSPTANITLIDLAAWNLPLYNEPGIPSKITSPDQYVHEHTKAWSREISTYDGFIFVTPQYNWSIPASLKNAIDYLYHEWTGKPALIVSYGGHGGGKAAAHLREVLQGLRMTPVERMVGLMFPEKEVLMKAAGGEDLGLLEEDCFWRSERVGIRKGFEELVGLIG